jgi:predicted transcriptional regulator
LRDLLFPIQPKKPIQYEPQELEGKSDLELVLMAMDNEEDINLPSLSQEWHEAWNKAQRIQMIRVFEHSTGRQKAKCAQALESFA